jgi:hypothetical protein
MATEAQTAANRQNAQHTTRPRTEAGKETSSRNNFRHGLTGHAFFMLEWENADHFDRLKQALRDEQQPATPTEEILVEKMAQHQWLSQHAESLQGIEMQMDPFDPDVQKRVGAYIRYQAQYTGSSCEFCTTC